MDTCELAVKLAARMSERITARSLPNWPEIRLALAELGREYGFAPRLTDPANKAKELLWDVLSGLTQTPCVWSLSLNRRWVNTHIVEDFQRLLYAKTTVKLMICDRGSIQGPRLLDRLETDMLAPYDDHIAGEEYLVFDCYGDRAERETRQLHCYHWRAPEGGHIERSEIQFRPLCSPIPYTIQD